MCTCYRYNEFIDCMYIICTLYKCNRWVASAFMYIYVRHPQTILEKLGGRGFGCDVNKLSPDKQLLKIAKEAYSIEYKYMHDCLCIIIHAQLRIILIASKVHWIKIIIKNIQLFCYAACPYRHETKIQLTSKMFKLSIPK